MEKTQFFGHFYIEHTGERRARMVYCENGLTIGLRSIKYHPDMSEETICYSANVDINGKKSGYSSNDGRGASSSVNFYDNKDFERFMTLSKPHGFMGQCEILDWLVCLTLDLKDNLRAGARLGAFIEKYPKDGLW